MSRLPKEIQPQSTQPQIRWKGSETYRHDLFKLGVAKLKKNISWKKKLPEIIQLEHTHLFHSHDNKGQVNKTCVPVAGHYHEVMTLINQDGELIAKCGPPIRKVEKRLETGKIKSVPQQVQWVRQNQQTGEDELEVDNHVHEVIYLASEEISAAKITEIQKSNASSISAMNIQAPRQQPASQIQGVEIQELS